VYGRLAATSGAIMSLDCSYSLAADRLQLESKDQMRVRGVPSPDEWDAVALTFAEPVQDSLKSFYRVIEYPKSGII
jgi:hypothetical protein